MSDKSRRKLLKSIAAGSGAVIVGKSPPENWTKPVVNSVLLPAHAQTSTLYTIGDTGPCGGIIFYITPDGLNGLEAAPVDQGTAPWGCSFIETGAAGISIGTGAANTTTILAAGACAIGGAAEAASNYAGGGCMDWYLPSRDELNAMYTQLHLNGLGGFTPGVVYNSSSENGGCCSSVQLFDSGNQWVANKTTLRGVRAVRNF